MLDDIKTNPVMLTGVIVGIIGIGVALWGHFSKRSKAYTYGGLALAIGSFVVAFGSKYMPMPESTTTQTGAVSTTYNGVTTSPM